MDIKVGLTVTGQWIKSNTIMLVSSSVNIYHCIFYFSDEWEEYTKTAVFSLNSGELIEVPINMENECIIPWKALENQGSLFIGAYGIKNTDDGSMMRYPTVWTKEIKVSSGVPQVQDAEPPTPTQYEQFVSDVQEAANSAEASAKEAQEVAKKLSSYKIGHGLKFEEDGTTLAVNTVNNFDGDNTLPITAAAVQSSIGNIEIVLSTI